MTDNLIDRSEGVVPTPTDEEREIAEEQAADACPVIHAQPHPTAGVANQVWWPKRLNLRILAKNPPATNPLGEEFDYAKAFEQVDLDELKADIIEVLTTPQDWWPADFGHYGPRSEERRVGKECRCRWRPKH